MALKIKGLPHRRSVAVDELADLGYLWYLCKNVLGYVDESGELIGGQIRR